MSSIKKFASQTAIYGLSTMLARLLNFILTPLFVNVYTAKVYGIFTYMYSVASMVNAVLAFGMETTFFRYLNKYEEKKEKVYSNAFIAIACISAVFLAFTALFATDIALWLQDGKVTTTITDYVSFVKYFIYILVADALAVIPFARVRANGQPVRYSIIKGINILVFVGLNIFFIILVPLIIQKQWVDASATSWYKEGWVGYVFISNLVASIVTLLLLLPELLQLKLRFDWKLSKEMFIYSLPVLIANMSFIINENVDKFFLGRLLPVGISEQQLGIYGACCKLAIFLSIFVQAFRLGAEPFFFSHAKAKNATETYSRIMTWFVIAVCIIFVALVTNIEILKYFIRANSKEQQAIYWSGLDVVPILLFGYVSLGIYMNLSIWYKLSDQTKYGLYISGAGALVTVVLNVIFIPKYSYMAAAWVSVTAYVTMMVLSYLMGRKNYPIPYDLKKIGAYLVSSAALAYLSFVVFERNLIVGNVLLIVFVACAFFAERRELKLIMTSKWK